MLTIEQQIYFILDLYSDSTKPQSIGGGYIEDSRVNYDMTKVSSFDEDIPIGSFHKGVKDESLKDYLPSLINYTKRPLSELKTIVDSYYKSKHQYAKVPTVAYEVLYTLNQILTDIKSEPTVLCAFGWED